MRKEFFSMNQAGSLKPGIARIELPVAEVLDAPFHCL
jgi:hypothetical protein